MRMSRASVLNTIMGKPIPTGPAWAQTESTSWMLLTLRTSGDDEGGIEWSRGLHP